MKTKMSFAKLSPLQIGVTKVVCSPIECGEVLVRTGMVDTKYNFIHSVLYSSNTDFQSLSIAEKTKEIDNVIDTIKRKTVDVVLRERFEKLATKIEWEQMVIEISKSVADYVYDKIRSSKMRVNDIVEQDDITEKPDVIFHVCKYNDIVKNVLPKVFTDANSLTIPESIVLVNKYVKVAVDATLHDKTKVFLADDKKKMFSDFIREVFVRILMKAKNQITEKIRQNTPFTLTFDKNTLMIISNIVDRDIYLLNGDTRLPYSLLFKEEMKLRKSIILMLLDDGDESGYKYFEPVGKMYSQNKVSREFEHKEPIIQKIFTFLYDKAQISESLYANLLPYLDTVKTTVKRGKSDDVETITSVRNLMKPPIGNPPTGKLPTGSFPRETEKRVEGVEKRVENGTVPRVENRYPSDGGRYPQQERYPPRNEERYPPRNEERYPPRNEERYPLRVENRTATRNEERYPSDGGRYPPRNEQIYSQTERYPSDGGRYPSRVEERYPRTEERYPRTEERYPRNEERYYQTERYPSDGGRYPPRTEERTNTTSTERKDLSSNSLYQREKSYQREPLPPPREYPRVEPAYQRESLPPQKEYPRVEKPSYQREPLPPSSKTPTENPSATVKE